MYLQVVKLKNKDLMILLKYNFLKINLIIIANHNVSCYILYYYYIKVEFNSQDIRYNPLLLDNDFWVLEASEYVT